VSHYRIAEAREICAGTKPKINAGSLFINYIMMGEEKEYTWYGC